jgi:hypothetical protein
LRSCRARRTVGSGLTLFALRSLRTCLAWQPYFSLTCGDRERHDD